MGLTVRMLLVICLTSASWAFSFGLGSQLVSRWLNAQGVSDTVIGLDHSFYYFGVALGSYAVPRLTRRLGPVSCAGFGMLLSGVTLAVYPSGAGDLVWHLLRFANGWAGAMALVPLETLVSRDSASGQKTLHFACYGVSLTLGGALGIEMAPHLYHLDSVFAFQIGGWAPGVATLLLLSGLRGRARRTEALEVISPLGIGRNFLSYGTAWAQGFLEGGMVAFLALFLVARGFSDAEAGTLMSVSMVGVILVQLPVSWLADRYGKMPLLLVCYGVVIAGLVAIPLIPNSVGLAVTLFCFGACTGAMYPLGLSLLSDSTPESSLARAYAWYLAIECVGSQAGAAAMGKARDLWGESSMFTVGVAAVSGVLLTWLALRIVSPGAGQPEIVPPVEANQRDAA